MTLLALCGGRRPASGDRKSGIGVRLRIFGALALAASPGAVRAAHAETPTHCETLTVRESVYVVCRFDPETADIRLFHSGADGELYRHFGRLESALEEEGLRLLFAMNAGMYMANRTPVGLYVEGGVMRRPVNNRNCKGNFCLKPNGVFWVGADGMAGVIETPSFSASVCGNGDEEPADGCVLYATQSGPMLVIDGKLHPKFNKDSTSLYRRNGVGVTKGGDVVFAISDEPVTFHEFATLFRDDLDCPNALYLDGAISRLYAPEIDRNEPGAAMGPIVGVVGAAIQGEQP